MSDLQGCQEVNEKDFRRRVIIKLLEGKKFTFDMVKDVLSEMKDEK